MKVARDSRHRKLSLTKVEGRGTACTEPNLSPTIPGASHNLAKIANQSRETLSQYEGIALEFRVPPKSSAFLHSTGTSS